MAYGACDYDLVFVSRSTKFYKTNVLTYKDGTSRSNIFVENLTGLRPLESFVDHITYVYRGYKVEIKIFLNARWYILDAKSKGIIEYRLQENPALDYHMCVLIS